MEAPVDISEDVKVECRGSGGPTDERDQNHEELCI